MGICKGHFSNVIHENVLIVQVAIKVIGKGVCETFVRDEKGDLGIFKGEVSGEGKDIEVELHEVLKK